MDHEVPEPTCKPKDPVPVTLAETISEAIAAGRVKIIVTGTGEKEDLSESESRCHCSSQSIKIRVSTKLDYTPEYIRRVAKDREIREEFFAKTPEGLNVVGSGGLEDEEKKHGNEGVETSMRQTNGKGLGGKSNVGEMSVKTNVTVTPGAKTGAAENENGNGTKPDSKSQSMAKAGVSVSSLNSEHHVQDTSTPPSIEPSVVKNVERSSELSQAKKEEKGTKAEPMGKNMVGKVSQVPSSGQEQEMELESTAPSSNLQGAEGSRSDEEKVDFVILGDSTLASDINHDDDWVCVGDDGF